jgi:RHS repeat-associated protein
VPRNEVLPYQFTGKELDRETGLYYYGARYLDLRASRRLSADPAAGEYVPAAAAGRRGGNLPGMSGICNAVNLRLYHYAGNNPVKYTDPDGRNFTDFMNWAKSFSKTIRTLMPLITTQATENDLANITNWINGGKITWDQSLIIAIMIGFYIGFYKPITNIVNYIKATLDFLTYITFSISEYLQCFIHIDIAGKDMTIGIETKPPRETQMLEFELPQPPPETIQPSEKIPGA